MEHRLAYYGLEATFVPAVDKNSPLVDWYSFQHEKMPRWEPSMRSEVACFLSHLKAIRTGLQEFPSADYYFILEDDALFRDDFFEAMPKWLQQGLDVVVPCGQNFRPGLAKDTCAPGLSWYHREKWGTWSAIGYFISRFYAQETLNLFDRPLRYLPYPRLVSEIIHRQAPKAAYTEDAFILEDGYDSTIRPQGQLEAHQRWFEHNYDYHRFLQAEGISFEEFNQIRTGIKLHPLSTKQ
jgi:GR25 family glycosyltransferase involved in LPS biosynthesis